MPDLAVIAILHSMRSSSPWIAANISIALSLDYDSTLFENTRAA